MELGRVPEMFSMGSTFIVKDKILLDAGTKRD